MIFPPSLETWAEPNLTLDYPGPATAQILGGALGYGQGGGMPGMAGMGGTSPGWMNWSQGVRDYARPQPPMRPPEPIPGSYPTSSPGFLGNVWPMYGMPRPEALGQGFSFPPGYEQQFQPFRFPPGYEQQFQPFELPPSLPYPYNLTRFPYPYNLSKFPWGIPGAMPGEAGLPLPAPARYPQAPTAPLVPPEAQVAPRREEEGAALRRARRSAAKARHEKEVPKGYEAVAASLPPGTPEEDIEAEWAYRTGRSTHKPKHLTKEEKEEIRRISENISFPGGL